MIQIDINCDMGESYGHFKVGDDANIFPYITSANIACGFHGGDPVHIDRCIRQALEYEVNIGAHPGYPDLAGFGRRDISLKMEELVPIIKYQISALKGMVESLGGKLNYVKPHGALYNKASKSEAETLAIISAIQQIDPELKFMGLAGSLMEKIASEKQIPFVAEAFADRRYEATGHLMSRSKETAVITDPMEAAEQVLSISLNKRVQVQDGLEIPVDAQSICIHGDNTSAVSILEKIQFILKKNGIRKQSFS